MKYPVTIETHDLQSLDTFQTKRSLLCDAIEASPHLRKPTISSQRVMWDVLFALTPAVLGSIYFFGPRVLPYYILSLFTALATSALVRLVKREVVFFDASAAVTGVLFAMSMPSSSPWWFMIVGPAFGLIVGKELFGGLGRNFLNPALVGRALLRIVFAGEVLKNPVPNPPFASLAPDIVAGSTPLALVKDGVSPGADVLWNSFIGNVGGKMGETSALLLLIGVAYLLFRGVIRMRIPAATLLTMVVLAFVFGGQQGLFSATPAMVLTHLLGGATVLGVFYMATDYGSSPTAPAAQWLFGIGLGVCIMLWRFLSPWPEGFTFAMLTMNLTVPLFNRFFRMRVVGETKGLRNTVVG